MQREVPKAMKKTKKKLGDVVTYINHHSKEKKQLTPAITKHMKMLIDLWRAAATYHQNQEFYSKMKDHHSFINSWIYGTIENEELQEMWSVYIHDCVVLRLSDVAAAKKDTKEI